MRTGLLKKSIKFMFAAAIAVAVLGFDIPAYAKTDSISIAGQQYVFEDEKSSYDYSSLTGEATSATNSIGTLKINGDLKSDGKKGTFASYDINEGAVQFSYTFNTSKYGTGEDEWHLVEDKTKKISYLELDNNILMGTVVLQTSLDGTHWIEDTVLNNVFTEDSVLNKPFYETNNFQLVNGCHYRVMVAYKIAKRTEDPKFGFDKYAYEKHLEVYEFFLHDSDSDKQATTMEASIKEPVEMGELIKVETDAGYSTTKEKLLDKDDPHFGVDKKVGRFFITGYTADEDKNGTVVFMKKPGDKITLWYVLDTDINKLWGNEKLSIAVDENGYDQNFKIDDVSFKRGTLIIKVKNKEGSYTVPPYTDFLAACSTTTANTKVELFEEGDYEVALDYEIVKDGVVDTRTNYRVSFKFSIRNANAMAYPRDIVTKSELSNSAYTKNGFWIDFANSKYIHVYVNQTILKETAGGRTETTGYNGSASDTDKFEKPGIYTVTITNEYTGRETTKTIYVGDDLFIKALAINNMSVKELENELKAGAEINDKGTLDYPEPEPEPEPEIAQVEEKPAEETTDNANAETNETTQNTEQAGEKAEEQAEVKEETATKPSTDENTQPEAVEEAVSEEDGAEVTEEETTKNHSGIVVVIACVSAALGGAFVYSRKKNKGADGKEGEK